jgi:hypothetical protein
MNRHMIPKVLLTSDLHFTDRPADAYRFEVFDWIKELCIKELVDIVCILGDLTDMKDRHSAKLVNRIVEELKKLSDKVDVVLLKGNHDYIDENLPFFYFLRSQGRITYVSDITEIRYGSRFSMVGVGHRRDDFTLQDVLASPKVTRTPDIVLIHQTIAGSLMSNGYRLDHGGQADDWENKEVKVFSGDVHVPQKVGPITYVGCPYVVRFGDTYDPRVLLWEEGEVTSVSCDEFVRRMVVTIKDPADLEDLDLRANDQIKVRIRLPRTRYADWAVMQMDVKKFCFKKNI